jgi:hypothetical protein
LARALKSLTGKLDGRRVARFATGVKSRICRELHERTVPRARAWPRVSSTGDSQNGLNLRGAPREATEAACSASMVSADPSIVYDAYQDLCRFSLESRTFCANHVGMAHGLHRSQQMALQHQP